MSPRTCCTSALRNSSLASTPALEGDVGVDALALEVVREPDHRGFGDGVVRDQRAFDLGGADAMAADVDHVVHAPGDQ